MIRVVKSTDRRVSKLKIARAAPYKVVARVHTGPVTSGTAFMVYAESHGDPRQKDKTRECATVSGISVYDQNGNAVTHAARRRGEDLVYAKKDADVRIDAFTIDQDYDDLDIQYLMRAVNLRTKGEFRISWVEVGAMIFEPAT